MYAVSVHDKSPSDHSKVNPIAVNPTATRNIPPKAGVATSSLKAADVEFVLAAVILGSPDVPFVYL